MKPNHADLFRPPLSVLLTVAFLTGAGVPAASLADLPAVSGPAVAGQPWAITTEAGVSTLRLTLKQPLAQPPAAFSVQKPLRVAIDLPMAHATLLNGTQTINQGVLASVYAGNSSRGQRLLLNLNAPASHSVRVDGNQLVVTLAPASAAYAFESRPAAADLMQGVDFHRGGQDSGLIYLNLPASGSRPRISEAGNRLVVDLPGIQVPARLARHMDVTDFGTPVQWFELANRRHGARLTIGNKGAWNQEVRQADGKLIIDIRPAPKGVSSHAFTSRYRGEKLSLDFQDIPVRQVLQLLGKFSKLNIIASDQVSGNISLNLHQVPWDEALQVILESKGLAQRHIGGNVLWIAPVKEVAEIDKQQALAQVQISDAEPVTMGVFHLKYQKAADMVTLLRPTGSAMQSATAASGNAASTSTAAGALPAGGAQLALLSARGSVTADLRTNALIISDTRESLQKVHDLLDKIDIPVRQVTIEARIVEANSDFSRNLGAKLGILGGITRGSTQVGMGGNLGATSSLGPGGNTSGGGNNLNDNLSVNLGAAVANPGSLAVQIFHGASKTLGLELSALEADGSGKILSNPRLMTSDQNEAVIEQGTEIPYTTGGGVGVPATTAFKKAVLSLRVKPQITPDNHILMDIAVNKDSVGAPVLGVAGGAPAIDTKQITTKVLVANGDTLVIGGIYTQQESDDVAKVPLLGNLPVLGNAFKTTSKATSKRELLIFVTPRVLSDGQVGF